MGVGIKLFVNKKFHQGFTLIELTAVIILISLIMFVAMPRLTGFRFQRDLKSVARSLKAAVQTMRSKSIATGTNTVLYFDLEKKTFWGTYEEQTPDALTGESKGYIISPYHLPEGIRFIDASNINNPKINSGILSTLFNSKGVLEETVIHLADTKNRMLTIIINAYTGRFLLYDEYIELEYGSK